jgi:hypothetical protein
MSEPNNQQWLDDAAKQARDRIASLHEEGLESLHSMRLPDHAPEPRTPPPSPASTAHAQEAPDVHWFGGNL